MKKTIFWGWYIVAAAVIFTTYNSTMFAYGFTTFLNPIAASYGWTFAQISLASSLRGLESGALDPLVGWAADRYKAKWLIIIGILILTIGTFIFARSSNLALFYLSFLIIGLGSTLSTILTPVAVISRWFRKNLGKASGILAMGMALGGLFAPLLVKGIDAFGWQNFVMYIAIVMLVAGILLAFVFRNRPEDYGTYPDGVPIDATDESHRSDYGVSTKQALKMRSFWFIAISQMLQVTSMHAVAVHLMPHLTSLGIERASAAIAITVFSFVGMGARLLYGIVADIFPKKYILAFSCGILTLAMIQLGLLDGSSMTLVIVFAISQGIGAAGAMPVRTPITREYFGAKNFGKIYGISGIFITVLSAIGTPVTGWVYDVRGTYNPIWFVYAGFTAVAMILCLLLPRPSSLKKMTAEVVTA